MPTITSAPSPDGHQWIQLTLVASRPSVTHRVEFLVFDGGALAGDVGGLMGILMGASILAMFDYLVGLVGMTRKCMSSKQWNIIFRKSMLQSISLIYHCYNHCVALIQQNFAKNITKLLLFLRNNNVFFAIKVCFWSVVVCSFISLLKLQGSGQL